MPRWTIGVIILGMVVFAIIQIHFKFKAEDDNEDKDKAKRDKKIAIVIDVFMTTIMAILSFLMETGVINWKESIEPTTDSTTIAETSEITTERETTSQTAQQTSTTTTTTITTTTTRPSTSYLKKDNVTMFYHKFKEDEDSSYTKIFIANRSGTYGFKLDINSVKSDYRVGVYSSKEEEIISVRYSDLEEHATSHYLSQGEYIIRIERIDGSPEATLTIYDPI